jgi:hypothetical protein
MIFDTHIIYVATPEQKKKLLKARTAINLALIFWSGFLVLLPSTGHTRGVRKKNTRFPDNRQWLQTTQS